MTIYESLQGINAYPVPSRTIETIMLKRGIPASAEADAGALAGAPYNLARADLLFWLSMAPGITQGGQSYSFTDEQRNDMRNEAQSLYNELEPDSDSSRTRYGYKGERL